jgi:hypothetical protein
MHYRPLIWSLLVACSTAVQAQEPTAPAPQLERAPAGTVLRAEEPIDPRILERIRLPVTSETPSRTIVVEPRTPEAATQPEGRVQPAESVTVDLGAVRSRVGPVSEIQVLREGRPLVSPSVEPETITLNRGDVLAVRRELAVQPVTEPGGVITASSATILYTLDASGRTRELGLVHRSAGLHWRPDRARFSGELLVGLLDRENPQARESLDGAAIPVQLLAPPGALDRTDLTLARIGAPFERVNVEVDVSGDPFTVDLVSQIDPDLPRAELRVFRPRVAISAPSALQGLGVEEAVVTVSAVGVNLRPGEVITLDLDNGWLADRTVVVDETGTASTRIRSDWLGTGTLSVLAPAIYEAEPKQIQYTAPVRFLAATLIGAMLGALVLVYMLKRSEQGSKRAYGMDWIVGVIIGAGATTMAYAGMKLPEWIPLPAVLAGEVAPFALAFICAAAGTALMHSIVGGARSGPVAGVP